MLRNILSFIFIYIFIVSCDDNVLFNDLCSEFGNCTLEISTELEIDGDGYYHLNFNDENNQTFTRIDAQVGHDQEYVQWTSDTYYCLEWNGFQQCDDVVNNSSYSGSDGVASTILGVHEQHIGLTVTIYAGYYYMDTQYLDSIKVVINE
tara:strand:+ start:119 stop:565 length:447 start_codon:yes stop_codon:yes gene_type:complete